MSARVSLFRLCARPSSAAPRGPAGTSQKPGWCTQALQNMPTSTDGDPREVQLAPSEQHTPRATARDFQGRRGFRLALPWGTCARDGKPRREDTRAAPWPPPKPFTVWQFEGHTLIPSSGRHVAGQEGPRVWSQAVLGSNPDSDQAT